MKFTGDAICIDTHSGETRVVTVIETVKMNPIANKYRKIHTKSHIQRSSQRGENIENNRETEALWKAFTR